MPKLTNENRPTIEQLIKHVYDHAIKHYNEGWDQWIECLEYSDQIDILEGCKTYDQALLTAAKTVKEQCEYAAIRAENCALYDTGEDSKTEFYNEIQRNADKTIEQLSGTLKDEFPVPNFAENDEDSCPNCRHYNAMLVYWENNIRKQKCRDCGHIV